MPNDSMTRLNSALFKQRVANNAGIVEHALLRTHGGKNTRYMDPLVRDRCEQIASAYDRERVAHEDPLGAMVTTGESLRENARLPKFYDSDQMDANEIGQGTRELLKILGFQRVKCAHAAALKTHGWALTLLWTDEMGQLCWESLNEMQVSPADFIRDWQVNPTSTNPNRVVGWRIPGRMPFLSLGRSMGNIRPFNNTIMRGQPGVIYTVRGDENSTFGFGISRLQAGWDSITKLRLQSHADAFRAQIFAQVVHPPEWSENQIDDLMEVLTYIDQRTALALPAGKNESTGELFPDLPSISFRSMAEDARSGSQSGGGGVFSNLSSEFVRFCGHYKIPISEVTGNPGGAVESADVDAAKAVEEKIIEYNLGREFDIQFVEFLQAAGAPIDLQPGFVVKGWQEWELHEKMQAEANQQMMEMEIEAEKASGAVENSGFVPPIIDGVAPVRLNAPPAGILAPITSSWVKAYGHGPATGMAYGSQPGDDSLYLQFHGSSRTFEYPVPDPAGLATEIEMSGSPGGWVHDELGVPSQVPYEPHQRIPSQMGYLFGAKRTHEIAAEGRRDKMALFGSRRPVYPSLTGARTESTRGGSGTLAGSRSALPVASSQMPTMTTASTDVTATPDTTMSQFNPTSTGATDLPRGKTWLPTAATTASPAESWKTGPGRARHTGAVGTPARHRVPAFGRATATNRALDELTRVAITLRANATTLDSLSVEQINDLSTKATGTGMSHSTIDKLRKMLRILEHQQHYRENYMAVGNAMSFRDHPYLYQNSDGTISVEYPCPKSWRENVAGVTTPLCINLEDPSEHGDHQIGTITHGWSDERDGPDDVLDYDRDALRTLLENSGATGSEVYRRLVVGLEPDVSTEYYCRHEVRNGRKWQVGFQPIRTCIVDRGNCPSGVCDFTPVEDPGHGDDDRDGFAA